MRALLFTAAVLTLFCKAFSQPAKTGIFYTSATIADSIRQGADAVYRLDEGNIEILSAAKYNYRIHNVVTVLNAKANRHFSHALSFDKFQKVENLEIKLFDSVGNKLATYTKKDFATKSYDDGISIFTDDKLMYLETASTVYPCTIETTYELKRTGYIGLPGWYIASPGEAVENSDFTIKVPANLDIRYKITGVQLQPQKSGDALQKIYSWKVNNLRAPKETESGGFTSDAAYAYIQLMPNQFDYDGYVGGMKTWGELGAWNYPMYNDEKNFNTAQTDEIKFLVADCKTNSEKVTVLYDYLKKNMRYVSVQLGIGGFKPFAVQYVHEKKYGDCKALTHYMRYLLRAVDIPSHPA